MRGYDSHRDQGKERQTAALNALAQAADVLVMMTMQNCFLAMSVLVSSACDLESAAEGEDRDRGTEHGTEPARDSESPETAQLTMPMTDLCDDPSYANVAFAAVPSGHFVLYVLPGTAAERDQGEILRRLESAYAHIRTTIGLQAEPAIAVYLSPNRLASAAHGRSNGMAFVAQNRYEAIYTGAADSYEVQRFGHELTHILEYHLDSAWRHPLFKEGLAEYLDNSGRDMHEAYAQQLIAGMETRVRAATFETRDLTASNYGRAGSLVQFLIERYGMPKFMDILRASTVTWINNCYWQPALGCISTVDSLTAMIDGALMSTVGEHWATAQIAWAATVQSALTSVDVSLPAADETEIKNLFKVMDLAVTTGDAATYRRTMDGFYCSAGTDELRAAIASRAVAAFSAVSSRVEGIYATGIRNFRTAQVVVRRSDPRGLATFATFTVEHFLAGWRVTYGPDWY